MKLWHCRKCHHEYEGRFRPCDWCGADKPQELATFDYRWNELVKKYLVKTK